MHQDMLNWAITVMIWAFALMLASAAVFVAGETAKTTIKTWRFITNHQDFNP